MYSLALGGVKLQVLAADYNAAARVLRQHLNGEFEAALAGPFPDMDVVRCPECDSQRVRRSVPPASAVLLVVTLGLFGVLCPAQKNKFQCKDCGASWRRR